MRTASGTTSATGFKIDFASSGTGTTGFGSLGEGVSFTLSQFTVGSANVATRSGTTATAASTNALLSLDSMINNVSRMRSQVGAYENSLGSNMDYLDRYAENLRGARSRVQDVDVAAESADTSRAQILQQSAATMLSQANATPQIALNLLP
jgi:flagellin